MTQTAGWVIGGRYRVTDRLGSGGAADVFRAHDELLGRDVAVKVFMAPGRGPDRPGAVERRAHDLGALAALSHQNLVRLFDASLDERPAYLVMELVDGPSLAERLEDGPLPEARVRTIGAQLADALAYIHAHGMVHGDVKTANVLIGSDALVGDRGTRARLSDFGIGPAAEHANSATEGPPDDVHSLGLVLLEALTGAARGPVPADLPPPWPALLGAMTADDPAARPTAGEVSRTLHQDAVTDAPTELISPALVRAVAEVDEPVEAERRRRAWWLVAAAVLMSGVIGVAGYFAVAGSLGSQAPPPLSVPSTQPAGTHHPSRPSSARSAAPAPAGSYQLRTSAPPRPSTSSRPAAPSTSASPTAPPSSTAAPSSPTSPPPSSSATAPPSGTPTILVASSPPPQ